MKAENVINLQKSPVDKERTAKKIFTRVRKKSFRCSYIAATRSRREVQVGLVSIIFFFSTTSSLEKARMLHFFPLRHFFFEERHAVYFVCECCESPQKFFIQRRYIFQIKSNVSLLLVLRACFSYAPSWRFLSSFSHALPPSNFECQRGLQCFFFIPSRVVGRSPIFFQVGCFSYLFHFFPTPPSL